MKTNTLIEDLEADSLHSVASVRGPRSSIANTILYLLYTRPMKSRDIASIIGKSSKYVSSYLSYWKSRGFVNYVAGYWFLTELGKQYVELLIKSTSNSVGSVTQKRTIESISTTINHKNKQEKADDRQRFQQFIVEKTSSVVGKQDLDNLIYECIEKMVYNKNLDEEETFVILHMVKHYLQWHSTYVYLDQLVEELDYDIAHLMNILKRLQSKKLIYIYNDRKLGLRVGIGKALKDLISLCRSRLDKQNSPRYL